MSNFTDLPFSLSVALRNAMPFSVDFKFSFVFGFDVVVVLFLFFSLLGGRGMTKTGDHHGVSHDTKSPWVMSKSPCLYGIIFIFERLSSWPKDTA